MGFVMPHITVLIGAGAVGLALVLQIFGVATPGWTIVSVYDPNTDVAGLSSSIEKGISDLAGLGHGWGGGLAALRAVPRRPRDIKLPWSPSSSLNKQLTSAAGIGPSAAGIGSATGLWKTCTISGCEETKDLSGWLNACRAFGIFGVLAMAASLTFALLICFMSEQKNLFGMTAPIAAAVGAFCALIEFAVYAGANSGASFGYSFGVTIVACILSAVAAVLFFLGRSRNQ